MRVTWVWGSEANKPSTKSGLGTCLLVASFSWIQGLAEVCGDSGSRWELWESLPNTRADPHPWQFPSTTWKQPKPLSTATTGWKQKENIWIFFFPYKIKATFRMSILLASYTFPFSALGGKQKHFQHSSYLKNRKWFWPHPMIATLTCFLCVALSGKRSSQDRAGQGQGLRRLDEISQYWSQGKPNFLVLQWGFPCSNSLAVRAGPERSLKFCHAN